MAMIESKNKLQKLLFQLLDETPPLLWRLEKPSDCTEGGEQGAK